MRNNTKERGRPYHKTTAPIFPSRLLQIGDHQWPHTKKNWPKYPRHDAYLNRSSRWPSSKWGEMTSNLVSQSLSANLQWIQPLQICPNYQTRWKLSVANNVWTSEDRNMGSHSASDDTHCPDTRRRFPREWLTSRGLKPLTRQAPDHLPINTTLKILDEDRHCNDPMLPRKLSVGCLYPRCEERPAPICFVLRTPRCNSHAVLPNACNKTKSEDTSHWEWWTKHATNRRHTRCVDKTGQMEILTKTSLRDHVTSKLTRTADRMNCTQSWYTSS